MKLTMRNPNFQTVSLNSASIRSYCPKTVQKRFSSIYGFKIFTRMPKKRSEIILISEKANEHNNCVCKWTCTCSC